MVKAIHPGQFKVTQSQCSMFKLSLAHFAHCSMSPFDLDTMMK